MPNYHLQLHELGFTLPQALSADDLPQLFADFFNLPGIDPETIRQPKGRNGYYELYTLKGEHGADLISICIRGAGNLQGTSHLLIHGDALETGKLDVVAIASDIVMKSGWGTSAHLALDDHDNLLPWQEIKDCCTYGAYSDRLITRLCKPSKDRKSGEMKDNPPTLLIEEGETLYLGKRKSDTSICLYNRRGPIRVELRLSDRGQVTDLLQRIAAGDDIGPIAAGLLRHNLVFVGAGHRRKDRRPVCQWWIDFLGNAEKQTLSRHRGDNHRSAWYAPADPVSRLQKRLSKEMQGKYGEAIKALILDTAAELTIKF
jgi:hypothetical protein